MREGVTKLFYFYKRRGNSFEGSLTSFFYVPLPTAPSSNEQEETSKACFFNKEKRKTFQKRTRKDIDLIPCVSKALLQVTSFSIIALLMFFFSIYSSLPCSWISIMLFYCSYTLLDEFSCTYLNFIDASIACLTRISRDFKYFFTHRPLDELCSWGFWILGGKFFCNLGMLWFDFYLGFYCF